MQQKCLKELLTEELSQAAICCATEPLYCVLHERQVISPDCAMQLDTLTVLGNNASP